MEKLDRAAEFLDRAHRERRRYENLPREIAPDDLAEAYAVQRRLHALRRPRLGEIVGWKIAVTTPAMRRILALPRPVVGGIFAGQVHRCPTTIAISDFGRACLEFEIALRLAADLPGREQPYLRAELLAAVGAACPAFELVDDRHADYAGTQGLSLCADNAWNAGIACGEWVEDPPQATLDTASGRVEWDGAPAGQGESTPLDALGCLASELAHAGLPLRRGMIVMSGSLVATRYPAAGTKARFAADGLGAIEIAFE